MLCIELFFFDLQSSEAHQGRSISQQMNNFYIFWAFYTLIVVNSREMTGLAPSGSNIWITAKNMHCQ